MPTGAILNGLVADLRRRCGDGPTDGELLARFAGNRDEAAFAELVGRHGRMVLGVAGRHLHDRHAAEDVLQATFLALARNARRLGRPPSLVNWLYTVAVRQARTARLRATRRNRLVDRLGAPTSAADPLAEITGRELVTIIDAELARLPERYRLPLVLCAIEGLSREETARRLGWPAGSVKGRLERGRELLRRRLAARGLTVPALLAGGLLAAPAEALPPALVRSIAAAALATPVSGGAVRALAILLTVTALGVGAGTALLPGGKPEPKDVPPVAAAAPGRTALDDLLPGGATRRYGSPRYRHVTRIEDLAVSADQDFAVANSRTLFHGALRAYALESGDAFQTFNDSGGDIGAIAISPDGKTLATSCNHSGSYSVFLRDVSTGNETVRIPLTVNTSHLLYAPDGKHLMLADGKAFHLLELAKREVVRTFPFEGRVFAAALSPDGKQLVVGGYDNAWFARRWEVDTGRELDSLPIGNNGVRSITFSADGATIAVGGENGKAVSVLMFDAAGKVRLAIPYPDASIVRSVAFSPDGKTIAASGGSTTRLFDTAAGQERVTIDRQAIGLRFVSHGATLVGAVAGTIYRWDVATGKSLIPEGGDSPVAQVAVTLDGKWIVSRGQEADMHVWNARTGEHLRRLNVGSQAGFALSPDGRFLVWPVADEAIKFKDTGGGNSIYTGSRLRVMEVATGALVERFGAFAGDTHDLFFTPDGKTLVTADRYRRDAGVRVWNFATGMVERSFPAEWKPTGRVLRTRLSPDGKVLGVMYQGQSRGLLVESAVKLWDIATGKEVAGLKPHWFVPEVMAIAPDGKTMAVAPPPFGTSIQFHWVATGEMWGYRGPCERATAVAFGPDGQLFTGTQDGTVLAWEKPATKPADAK
jgi:RNA polymerase sigma factor (sigma-70 family)